MSVANSVRLPVMARKKKHEDQTMEKVTLFVRAEQMEALKRFEREYGANISESIRRAIDLWIKDKYPNE